MRWSAALMSTALVFCFVHTTSSGYCASTERERPLVALLVEGSSERLVRQLRDELAAFGFDSAVLQPSESVETPAQVQALAEQRNAAAALRIRSSSGGVEIWIVDRMTGKTTMREVATTDEDAGSEQALRLVAIRTVELLRASLLEIQLPERPPAPVDIPQNIEDRVVARPRPFAMALGVGTVWALGGLAPTLQLDASVLWRPLARLHLGAVGSMPLIGTRAEASQGTATTKMARMGLVARFPLADSTAWAVPWIGLGGDALFVEVGADAAPGYSAETDSSWRLLARTEAGSVFRLSRQFGISLDAWLGLTPQQVVVRFEEEPVTTIGPVLLGATLEAVVEW